MREIVLPLSRFLRVRLNDRRRELGVRVAVSPIRGSPGPLPRVAHFKGGQDL